MNFLTLKRPELQNLWLRDWREEILLVLFSQFIIPRYKYLKNENISFPESTVRNIMVKIKTTGSYANLSRSGRPNSLDEREIGITILGAPNVKKLFG